MVKRNDEAAGFTEKQGDLPVKRCEKGKHWNGGCTKMYQDICVVGGFVISQATVGDGRQPTQRLQKLKDAGQGRPELLLVRQEVRFE